MACANSPSVVLPNLVFGKSLDKEKFGYPSTTGILATIFSGEAHPFLHMLRGRKLNPSSNSS